MVRWMKPVVALAMATTLLSPAAAQKPAPQPPRGAGSGHAPAPAMVGPLELRVENAQLVIGRRDPALVIRLSIRNPGPEDIGLAVAPQRSNVVGDTNDVFAIPEYHGLGVSGIQVCLDAEPKRCETSTVPAGSRVIAVIRPQPKQNWSVSTAQVASLDLVFFFTTRNRNEVNTHTISFSDVPVQRIQAQ